MMNLSVVHFFAYSLLLGATFYQTFFVACVAHRILPADAFAKLHDHLIVGYFAKQAALSSVLALSRPTVVDCVSGTCILIILGSAFLNLVILTPLVHRVAKARDAQAQHEGKNSNDPAGSQDLKKLNSRYSKVHSISVFLNLALFFSLLYYGYLFIYSAKFPDSVSH